MSNDCIRVVGARQNNLKNLTLEIPLYRLIAVTGVSGSGKSSLAFDTLYAEGQRRYVETFSPYARQFMERRDKPLIDRIEGIPPAIAISGKNLVKTSRSTVGTMTEITDYGKLLFSKIAHLFCYQCGQKVQRDTPLTIWNLLLRYPPGKEVIISFPYRVKGIDPKEVEGDLRRLGFHRVYHQGQVVSVESGLTYCEHELPVIMDRVILQKERKTKKRIIDSLEGAFRFGSGRLMVTIAGEDALRFSSHFQCSYCNVSYHDPAPHFFSYNSPLGACETCKGFGRVMDIDIDLVIPDKNKTLKEGAIKPWTTASTRMEYNDLMTFCRSQGIPTTIPFKDLGEKATVAIISGTDKFYGVRGFFQWLESKKYKMHVRVFLSRYRTYTVCDTCQGTRFKPAVLRWRIGGKNIGEIYGMTVEKAHEFFNHLRSAKLKDEVAARILAEIQNRLRYLMEVGLGYLALDRQSRTLSGGEVQRVNLTTALGSSLANALYLLDEPSIGLHPRDNLRLVAILRQLKGNNNTVIVVDHDPAIITKADIILDLGPGAGERGGEVVYFGPAKGIRRAKHTLTGKYLSGALSISVPLQRRDLRKAGKILIKGAREHNLKNVDIEIPLGMMVCITGVSGSGKSTLVEEILYRGIKREKGYPEQKPGQFASILGTENIRDVVLVDQRPIGETPRSNPVTFLKVFDWVRTIFSATPLARERGYTAGTFSFNVEGGRCEQCRGEGFERVEMQFLADTYVTCPACNGKRYQEEVLEVRFQGRNIVEVLNLTAEEGLTFFTSSLPIVASLTVLHEVGLGYLKLGQPLNTLSGGEAQRLKLAKHICGSAGKDVLFLFDEPTIGLHFDDVAHLLRAFQNLIERGNSVVIVEHNGEVIKCADYVVDLGPEGGDAGGEVVVAGPPETVAQCPDSWTGTFLRTALALPDAGSEGKESKTAGVVHKGIAATKGVSIVGAREHNLRNVSITFPREKLVVITGMSGSGKSTLAFDILFAEGQRRYLDTLTPYVRQYLKIMDKPEVDAVAGIPPTVAIEQQMSREGKRSIVATVTEIYHFLRLLYSKLGVQHCPSCDQPITTQRLDQMESDIRTLFRGEQVAFLAPKVRGRKGFHHAVFERAVKSGYSLARINGKMINLTPPPRLPRYHEHDIEILVAKTVRSPKNPDTMKGLIQECLREGGGSFFVVSGDGREKRYSSALFCPQCNKNFEPLDPRMFSFNSRQGACPQCDGLGFTTDFDEELILAYPDKPLGEGAFAVLEGNSPIADHGRRILRQIETRLGIPLSKPFAHLRKKEKEMTLYGSNHGMGKSFEGLIPILRSLGERCAENAIVAHLNQFMRELECPACHGNRLKESALAVKVEGLGIWDAVSLSVADAERLYRTLPFKDREENIGEPIRQEIIARLTFLLQVGLSYLTLHRRGDTLSGGESQRIRLAAQLGSNLRGACYILDEPTIGLHPRDSQMLLHTLKNLRDAGNTLVVVEHDEQTIREGDYIIDLGPGGGTQGGRLVAAGQVEDLERCKDSITGQFLLDHSRKALSSRERISRDWLWVVGAKEHNLKHITVSVPLGTLVCVTGVSGSGKSTLLKEVIYRGVKRRLQEFPRTFGNSADIKGWESLSRILEVDHAPIGRTPKSTPVTYIGIYDEIRRLFSLVPEARMRGYRPGRFSFNLKGGRCEACAGQGRLKVEMSFLPDVYVDCEVCEGRRFNEETLDILYKGKSIADVLTMTVDEAADFFVSIPAVSGPLKIISAMGLGYLTLGQPSPTLSGGEAQRIKLGYEFSRPITGKAFYILDEPTTGLHAANIDKLLIVLQGLVDRGNTVAIIEHNLDVIRAADYIIDLGPEGGDRGGELVACGSPREFLRHTDTSYTARFLHNYVHDN